jgi:predicted TIM-barrel fold metal-dependent hydrolase
MLPSEPGRPIPYLDNVAHEFPELVILAGHIGVPRLGEMVSLMMKPERLRGYLGPQSFAVSP